MEFLLHFITGLASTAHAAAEQLGGGPGIAGMWGQICDTLPFCGGGTMTFVTLSCKIVRFIWQTIGAAAVCFIIYGGVKIILSQGESVDAGKKIVMHAALGLVLALIAGAVIGLVIGIINELLGPGFDGVFVCFA